MARILFRVVHDPMLEEDFLSNLGKCKEQRGAELHDPLIWAGLSMFETPELASATARRYKMKMGTHLAELHLPEDEPHIHIRPSLGPGHYTVLGCAGVFEQYIKNRFVIEA